MSFSHTPLMCIENTVQGPFADQFKSLNCDIFHSLHWQKISRCGPCLAVVTCMRSVVEDVVGLLYMAKI